MTFLIHPLSRSNQLILNTNLLLIVFSFFSCASQQKKLPQITDAPALITYQKERTRGLRNPLFTVELLESEAVRYIGIANVPVIGEKIITIDHTSYNAILAQFEAANFTSFKTVYKGKMRDLPLTSITFKEHTVTYQEGVCPKELRQLAKLMEKFIPEQ